MHTYPTLCITYYHGHHQEDGTNVGSIRQDPEGWEEGEEDEDGQQNGIDLPSIEAYRVMGCPHSRTIEHPLSNNTQHSFLNVRS